MAKKTRTYQRKEVKEKSERRNRILILVVSVTMLFSGIWLFSGSPAPLAPSESINLDDYVEIYNVNEIGEIIVNITQVNNRLTIVPEHDCINSYIVREFENLSLPGVTGRSYEVAEPKKTNRAGEICGLYAFLNLDFEGDAGNISEALKSVKGIVGEFSVYRSVVGRPIQNTSIIDEVTFIANMGVEAGDCYEISLLERFAGDRRLGFTGLPRNPVARGPVVPAEVVGVTGVAVAGIPPCNLSEGDVNLSGVESIQIRGPEIVVEGALENKTLAGVRNLTGVAVTIYGNRTVVSFNSSRDELMGLLSGRNQTLEEGGLYLTLSLESDIPGVREELSRMGVRNVTFSRVGSVSVPDVVVLNGDIVFVDSNENLNSILGMNSSVGDKINVSLHTMAFQDKTYVMGSEETS